MAAIRNLFIQQIFGYSPGSRQELMDVVSIKLEKGRLFMTRPMDEPGLWESLKELLMGSRRMLDCLQVEVSSRCPGRCLYCPHTVFKENWRGLDMDMETFRRLWPLMRRAGRVHLQGWGEPLQNTAFFEMVALGRKAGCAVSTTTCGLGLTDAAARRVVNSGIDVMAFSLAGTDEAGNAARLGVPYAQVCASVERLQAVRRAKGGVHLEIHLAYLLLASNMAAVRRLPALMQRLGIHAAVVSTLDYLPDRTLEAEAFLPGAPGKLASAQAILTETAAEAHRLGMGFDYRLPQWDRPAAGCRENIARALFVSAEGDLAPCVYTSIPALAADDRRRAFGSIGFQEPLAIWENTAFRAFREGLAHGTPDAVCRLCPKRFMA